MEHSTTLAWCTGLVTFPSQQASQQLSRRKTQSIAQQPWQANSSAIVLAFSNDWALWVWPAQMHASCLCIASVAYPNACRLLLCQPSLSVSRLIGPQKNIHQQKDIQQQNNRVQYEFNFCGTISSHSTLRVQSTSPLTKIKKLLHPSDLL